MTRRGAAALIILAGIAAAPALTPPHLEGPPLAHTGGFGEPTCRTCHLGLALNDPRASLEVEGLGETFEPGRPYRIKLTVRGEGMGRAGFQATFRFEGGDHHGGPAGRVRAPDEYTRVARDPETGVEYVQHTEAGTELVDGLGQWVFDWVPPDRGTAVALHIAANSANGDDSPLEDFILTSSLELRPRR